MSASPPKADIRQWSSNVRYVPEADIERYSITSSARARKFSGIVRSTIENYRHGPTTIPSARYGFTTTLTTSSYRAGLSNAKHPLRCVAARQRSVRGGAVGGGRGAAIGAGVGAATGAAAGASAEPRRYRAYRARAEYGERTCWQIALANGYVGIGDRTTKENKPPWGLFLLCVFPFLRPTACCRALSTKAGPGKPDGGGDDEHHQHDHYCEADIHGEITRWRGEAFLLDAVHTATLATQPLLLQAGYSFRPRTKLRNQTRSSPVPLTRHFCCAGKTNRCHQHENSLSTSSAKNPSGRARRWPPPSANCATRSAIPQMELKTLISPTHIKKEIRNYVREEREGLMQSIQRRAQDNPLQMAAVGAAVAYPVWSLLRAIPTPLLLIGAGLFLTSKRGQQSAKEIKAKVDDVVQQGTEKVSDFAGIVRSDLEDRFAGARYGAEELRDTVTSAASAVADRAQTVFGDAADTAKDAANTAKGAVGSAIGDVAGQVASAAEGVSAAAGEIAESAKDQAAAMGTRSRDALTNFVNDNPLLVAGIGAAVGAFIAASIPSSDAENRLFGAGSEKLKDKAREAAAQGIERLATSQPKRRAPSPPPPPAKASMLPVSSAL